MHGKKPTIAILLITCFFAATFLFGAEMVERSTSTDALVEALRGQVELLRWVGSAMVGGLVAAVVALFYNLQKSQAQASDLTAKCLVTNDRVADAVESLKDELKRRPCLKGE